MSKKEKEVMSRVHDLVRKEKKEKEINDRINKLPYNINKRCPALDNEGYQCEDCQGHKGEHWVEKHKVYFNIARGIYKDE